MIVYVSQVFPHGGYVDLGHGLVGRVERLKGGDRCVVIPQKDGSELRIVIGPNE